MTEPFLVPLIGEMPAEHRMAFCRLYSKARQKDPTVHPPQSHILSQIRNGEVIAALVVCPDKQEYIGCFLLAVDHFHDALAVTVCAGRELDRWGHVMDQLAHRAADQLGLARLWVQGRRGLATVLKERGFVQKYIVYCKELGEDDVVRSARVEVEQRKPVFKQAGLSRDPEAVPPGSVESSATRNDKWPGFAGFDVGRDESGAARRSGCWTGGS